MSWIEIDGSFGEGGGQILRTSLSLSLLTGKAFRIDRIRAGRQKPGLLRQHLTAVEAAARVGGAKVEGAEAGSQRLTFVPGPVRTGEYRFAVGTAGSAALVLQTVLPALMLAPGESLLTLEGGTHNPSAPPFDFLERTFLPLIERMGPRVKLEFERYGFYPAGGGRFQAAITPVDRLAPLHLGERGEIVSRRIHATVVNLPFHIALRELATASDLLNWGQETWVKRSSKDSLSAGNMLMVEIGTSEVTELFTGFGQRGVTAEQVAADAAGEAREYLASTAAAGEHLADQLLLPMALAGEGSFTAVKLNPHARTNMAVIRRFLDVEFDCRDREGCVEVKVAPAAGSALLARHVDGGQPVERQ